LLLIALLLYSWAFASKAKAKSAPKSSPALLRSAFALKVVNVLSEKACGAVMGRHCSISLEQKQNQKRGTKVRKAKKSQPAHRHRKTGTKRAPQALFFFALGGPEPVRPQIWVLLVVLLTPRPLHWTPTEVSMGRAELRTTEKAEH
jgi:hypothetical protein